MLEMGDFQAYLVKLDGAIDAVDLLKIGQSHYQKHVSKVNKNKFSNGNFRIAVDMEDCLHRFYGGYYSDWACGGQWNRAYQFVQLLLNGFNSAHIEIVAFFDGTLNERQKLPSERNDFRQKTNSVLKHIRMVGTPPPKIWWLPPSGIRTCLRNSLRNFNIQVVQTVNNHTMEIIDYCREHKIDGILGLHSDYIIANFTRYFSSHDLRLSYKGSLETKEFHTGKLLSNLNLTVQHLPFVAVLLGAYVSQENNELKNLYQKMNIEQNVDFETKLKQIAEIVRSAPITDSDQFIKHLDIAEWSDLIKNALKHYQIDRNITGKLKKKNIAENKKVDITTATPIASETNDNDEITRKILNDVNNLVDEDDGEIDAIDLLPAEVSGESKKETVKNGNVKEQPKVTFVYTLPAEVLKTALNRHQRGIMDSKIYHLLTKKEIFLPQILEDEQYREIPSVHQFYRPARQMIYAILFNMFHQKYLIGKKDRPINNGSQSTKSTMPDISVAEWVWSPQNEYKQPETVNATLLPWAVPTIQRLWFGTLYEDKQRRMKAFLTVMRSDSPIMLNRDYVPQHMLAMACVLRYIVTHPDKYILTQTELNAFLVTAFSKQIVNVEYTQELVLPCVHLRGVYLATLFMQGVETVALANDACGVPLPWTMTNPWLFFDGKLFHLKLKLSSYVNLSELCDDRIEIVLKVERFRKAILENVEHYLMPTHMADPVYRVNVVPNFKMAPGYGKSPPIHPITNIPLVNGTTYYNPATAPQQQGYLLNNGNMLQGGSATARRRQQIRTQQIRQGGRNDGYQLKVGGVVVGSWAGGVPNKSIGSNNLRFLRAQRLNNRRKGNVTFNIRNQSRNQSSNNLTMNRSISRNLFGNKSVKNKNRRNRSKKVVATSTSTSTSTSKDGNSDKLTKTKNDEKSDGVDTKESTKSTDLLVRECTVEMQNGKTVSVSDLVNSTCDSDDSNTDGLSGTDENNLTVSPENTKVTGNSDTGSPILSTQQNDTDNNADNDNNSTDQNKTVSPTSSITAAATDDTEAKFNGNGNSTTNINNMKSKKNKNKNKKSNISSASSTLTTTAEEPSEQQQQEQSEEVNSSV